MKQEKIADSDNPSSLVVAIDSDVDFSKREFGGHTSYVVHHRKLGKFYRFGAEEYHIATMLNGSRTIKDVCDQLTRDGLQWKQEDVAKFVAGLVAHRLAAPATETPRAETPARGSENPGRGSESKRCTVDNASAELVRHLESAVANHVVANCQPADTAC